MIPGLAYGLERLWVMRFGPMHASQMLMIWHRYTGLGDTQLSGIDELTDIRLALDRAMPFQDTPFFGLGGFWPDTNGRDGP